MNKTNLDDWLLHIESFNPNEIDLGLSRIKQVAGKFDLLTFPGKVVLVGGTNGKGSCVASLEAMALHHGLNVGCYTSPHLVHFNERIRINGKQANDQLLIQAFNQIEANRDRVSLTFFEFTTLVALWIFKQSSLDLLVLEVGLGGRLDAVNIVEPDCSVITTIDYDHSDWLGDSLTAIAKEKAGITRTGKNTFVGDIRSLKLLKETLLSDDNLTLAKIDSDQDKRAIKDCKINPYRLLEQNIALAKQTFESLFSLSTPLHQVLPKIKISGRFQSINLAVPTVLDVAHNPQAAKNLGQQLKTYTEENNTQKVYAVCGMMADKAISEVLSVLEPLVSEWYFADLQIGRASTAEELLALYRQNHVSKSAFSFASVKLAYDAISKKACCNDLILVFGSFITVANMLQYEAD